MVKCDGSRRELLRSRGHLRKIQPSAGDRRWYNIDPQVQQGTNEDDVPLPIYQGLEQGARCFTRCTVITRCSQGERGDK